MNAPFLARLREWWRYKPGSSKLRRQMHFYSWLWQLSDVMLLTPLVALYTALAYLIDPHRFISRLTVFGDVSLWFRGIIALVLIGCIIVAFKQPIRGVLPMLVTVYGLRIYDALSQHSPIATLIWSVLALFALGRLIWRFAGRL